MRISLSQICKNSILMTIAILLLASSAKAQEMQLKVEPEKLTIVGTNKDKIKRTLVLTSDKLISRDRLQISFRDLYRADDEQTIFPYAAQIANLTGDWDSELEYKIPLEFDLSQSTSRGEFFGNTKLVRT